MGGVYVRCWWDCILAFTGLKTSPTGPAFMDYIDGERHVREGFIGRAFTGNLERLDPLMRGLQPPFLVGIYILRLCRYCTKEMRNTHAQCRAGMNHGMTNDKMIDLLKFSSFTPINDPGKAKEIHNSKVGSGPEILVERLHGRSSISRITVNRRNHRQLETDECDLSLSKLLLNQLPCISRLMTAGGRENGRWNRDW